MKLQKTLITTFILLFCNEISAENLTAQGCNKLLENGNSVAAIAYAKKMLSVNNGDKEALLCQGRAYHAGGDYKNAIRTFELAERNSRDGLDKTVAIFLAANAHKAAKETDLALAGYQKALSQAQAINNIGMQRLAYTAIGDMAIANQQYSSALDNYLMGFKLAANDNERAESAEKLAMAYHELNEHGLAVEYQIKAYLLHDTVGTLDQYANSSILLGRYYVADKNYVAAERTLNKIIAFAKEQGGLYYEAMASCILARIKKENGDSAAANVLLERAKFIAKSSNDKALADEINQEIEGMF